MPIAMNLFYNDDSALDPNKHTFFVYGGIEIPEENALWLHDAGIKPFLVQRGSFQGVAKCYD